MIVTGLALAHSHLDTTLNKTMSGEQVGQSPPTAPTLSLRESQHSLPRLVPYSTSHAVGLARGIA